MKLPSVTQIISPYSNFSGINPEVLANAAARGDRVHQACAAYALDFPTNGLEDEDVGYFESFREWFDASVVHVIAIEGLFEDEILGFCGHPDLLCIIDGDGHNKTVVDYKTPRLLSPAWPIQLSAYAHLTKAQRAFSLRLNPDGKKAIVDEVEDIKRHFAIFLNCLSAWKYFNGGK